MSVPSSQAVVAGRPAVPAWLTAGPAGPGARFVPAPDTWREAALDEAARAPLAVLLESGRPAGGAEVSLAASRPALALIAKGQRLWRLEGGRWSEAEGDPLVALEGLLADASERASPGAFPGLVAGAFGYDLGASIEHVGMSAVDDEPFPDLVVAAYGQAELWDHRAGRARTLVNAGLHAHAAPAPWPAALAARDASPRVRSFTRDGYLEAVRAVRAAIARGDVYQVNLAQRFAGTWPHGPVALHRALSRASPAPYAALVVFGDRALVSSSPESFLAVTSGRVVTSPIKGTRPRDPDRARDRALARELWASEKDRAELTMIIDLMRNDLGRVAVPGSVRVVRARTLLGFRTVWQTVATVEATLRPDAGVGALLRATFPGGSVTGAPKIAAMRVIEAHEPLRRGFFTGAIGFIGLDGTMRTSIAIRTIQLARERATFHAGGGIVWDSDPAAEYEETLVKARAMACALGMPME